MEVREVKPFAKAKIRQMCVPDNAGHRMGSVKRERSRTPLRRPWVSQKLETRELYKHFVMFINALHASRWSVLNDVSGLDDSIDRRYVRCLSKLVMEFVLFPPLLREKQELWQYYGRRLEEFTEVDDETDEEILLQLARADSVIDGLLCRQGNSDIDRLLFRQLLQLRMMLSWSKVVFDLQPGNVRYVECSRVRYSEFSCGSRFRNGPYAKQSLWNVVNHLENGILHPSKDTWLTLHVVEKNNKFISMDNQRLWCFHEWQQRTSSIVYVRVRIYQENSVVHCGSLDGYESIHVRA